MMLPEPEVQSQESPDTYLSLLIGNSRLHWGIVTPPEAIATWDTLHWHEAELQGITSLSSLVQTLDHRIKDVSAFSYENSSGEQSSEENLREVLLSQTFSSPLWIASVVSAQTQLWQRVVPSRVITLDDIPLHNLYATLGIDRALALLGAAEKFGCPVLVIDGGTALTFSGVDRDRHFAGGAIAPGLRLQGQSLSQRTAALPAIEDIHSPRINRWATQTSSAIQSGIVHILLAGIEDFILNWWQLHPNSPVVFTGGDGEFFFHQMQQRLQNQPEQRTMSNHPADCLHFYWPLGFEGICTLLSCSLL